MVLGHLVQGKGCCASSIGCSVISWSTVRFSVHLFNNANYRSSKHSKHKSLAKTKSNVQNLKITLRIPLNPLPLFSALCDLFWIFSDCTEGSPSFVSRFCTKKVVKKSQKTFFLHFLSLWQIKKIHFVIFSENCLKSLKGCLHFFPYCATNWSFKRDQRVPRWKFEL